LEILYLRLENLGIFNITRNFEVLLAGVKGINLTLQISVFFFEVAAFLSKLRVGLIQAIDFLLALFEQGLKMLDLLLECSLKASFIRVLGLFHR